MLTKSYIRKINNLCIYLRDLIGEDKMHAVFSVLNQVCIKNQDRLSKNHRNYSEQKGNERFQLNKEI